MASLPRALAMTTQVDGEGPKAVPRHSLREPFVPSGVLAEAMDDGEGCLSAGPRPRAICELRAVGRLDETPGRGGDLSCQGARSLSGS